MRPLPHLLTVLALTPFALLGCRAAEKDVAGDIQYLVRHNQWREALVEANRLVEANPNDPEAQALHRQVTVALLLERGRRLTFEELDDEALAEFESARELDPTNTQVLNWVDKTRRKLGRKWYERGRAAHADDNLEAAQTGYENALEYLPDNALAKEGLATTLLQINYRLQLSDDYYNDGVKAISDWKYVEAYSRFDYSSKYRPDDAKRKRRLKETAQQLARERVMVARSLEARELFGAAYGDYRVAFLMDEENTDAKAGLERTRIEAEAAKLKRKGDMFVLRGEFNNAEDAYREGRGVTLARHGVFDDAIARIDDERIERSYEHAIIAEHDFRYDDALRIYGEILEKREFFEDVLARRNTLRDYVDDAAELYEQARDADSPAARADYLRQIEIFWPEYLDIQDQLEVLRELIGDEPAPLAQPAPAEESTEPDAETEAAAADDR